MNQSNQNDIDLEEVTKANSLREERLKKMKNNIEAMQKNMNKKTTSSNNNGFYNNQKQSTFSFPKKIQHDESPTKNLYFDNEFGYNSNFYKQITNESQPLMDNGSAVSNFSSISKINNILNGNNNPRQNQPSVINKSDKNDLNQDLFDINNILMKIQKSTKLPTKAFQKYLDIKQAKQSHPVKNEEPFNTSKISQYSGENSVRRNIKQYKQFIKQMNVNNQDDIKNKQKDIQKQINVGSQFNRPQKYIINNHTHRRSQLSNFTDKSNISSSEGFRNYPPIPPSYSKKQSSNPVERQKAMLKESLQEYKKLQTERNSQLHQNQIDFQLSDQQNENSKQEKEQKIKQLINQKRQLELQLKKIEKQLQQLQEE